MRELYVYGPLNTSTLNQWVQTDHKPTLSRVDRLLGEADALGGILDAAGALIDGGRRLDIGGLDLRVGRLCAQCLDLEPHEGVALRPGLVALGLQIDRLSARMRPTS